MRRNQSNIYSNQKGSIPILMILMVALVTMTVTGAVMMNTEHLLKRTKMSIKENNDFQGIMTEIGMILSDRTLCTQNFLGQPVDQFHPTDLIIRYTQGAAGVADGILAAPNSRYKVLNISSVRIEPVNNGPNSGFGPNITRMYNLIVDATAADGSTGHTFTDKIPIFVSTDLNNLISSCYATVYYGNNTTLTTLQDAICQQVGGGNLVYDATQNKCVASI